MSERTVQVCLWFYQIEFRENIKLNKFLINWTFSHFFCLNANLVLLFREPFKQIRSTTKNYVLSNKSGINARHIMLSIYFVLSHTNGESLQLNVYKNAISIKVSNGTDYNFVLRLKFGNKKVPTEIASACILCYNLSAMYRKYILYVSQYINRVE